jgi:hypothetical protein
MMQQPAGTPRGALLSKGAWGQAARSDGGACGAPPGPEGLCFWHDPAQHTRRWWRRPVRAGLA